MGLERWCRGLVMLGSSRNTQNPGHPARNPGMAVTGNCLQLVGARYKHQRAQTHKGALCAFKTETSARTHTLNTRAISKWKQTHT